MISANFEQLAPVFHSALFNDTNTAFETEVINKRIIALFSS